MWLVCRTLPTCVHVSGWDALPCCCTAGDLLFIAIANCQFAIFLITSTIENIDPYSTRCFYILLSRVEWNHFWMTSTLFGLLRYTLCAFAGQIVTIDAYCLDLYQNYEHPCLEILSDATTRCYASYFVKIILCPVGFATPLQSLEEVSSLVCGRWRVAVIGHQMLCLVIILKVSYECCML